MIKITIIDINMIMSVTGRGIPTREEIGTISTQKRGMNQKGQVGMTTKGSIDLGRGLGLAIDTGKGIKDETTVMIDHNGKAYHDMRTDFTERINATMIGKSLNQKGK